MPVVSDEEQPLEVVAMAALSLGLAFASSCNADVAQALMTVLMERPQATLEKDSMTRLICLGVGLLYLGKQQAVEVAIELAKCLEGAVGEYCSLTLETCAYAGSGNVLKVQRLLELCVPQPRDRRRLDELESADLRRRASRSVDGTRNGHPEADGSSSPAFAPSWRARSPPRW